MGIVVKDRTQIAKMRATGRIVAAVLDAVEAACVPGTTTLALDRIAARVLERAGARSAFRGYAPGDLPPYPAVICASVNEVVIHGIPRRDVVLREGDLVGVDFACFQDGFCADAARTIAVGVVGARARALLDDTRCALDDAIAACQPDGRLGDVGSAVQRRIESGGHSVVHGFVGHGIGRAMHEEPDVPNVGTAGRGMRLRPGLVLALEPMAAAGRGEVEVLDDEWTVVTADRSLAAHFEHTVAITPDGPVVLTVA